MNDQWQDKLRESLDRSVDELDAATRSRLNQARQEALHERRSTPRLGWLPAAALGMAAVVALGLQLDRSTRPLKLPEVAESPAADMDLLLDSQSDLELLEDLEFYLWLDAQLDETG